MIPFLDLNKQYQLIKESIDSEIQKVIDKSAFVRGEYVSKFEREYAKACGTNECIACGNGTDAIYITLKALGIGQFVMGMSAQADGTHTSRKRFKRCLKQAFLPSFMKSSQVRSTTLWTVRVTFADDLLQQVVKHC